MARKDVVPSAIPSTNPHHEPWELTARERAIYRERSRRSRERRKAALAGEGPAPIHDINVPVFQPIQLMPLVERDGIRALSLFSGGGGLDLGFALAGFDHVASYEILEDAAATLKKAQPDWDVRGGEDGDVRSVAWRKEWRGKVDVLHGGPPCQPFSAAGRQRGPNDTRDMFPIFVDAVLETNPAAFVAENVPALATPKFARYVDDTLLRPLGDRYAVEQFVLRAEHFGVPQVRRRVIFVGFRSKIAAERFKIPAPRFAFGRQQELVLGGGGPQPGLGARNALGLPDIGVDALAPTIRSSLTGPRHTTSILSSTAARRVWERLQIWPNGVAGTRELARGFVAENGHFRLSVPDVALLQGFPEDWPFVGAVYMMLGQIGNAVPPPLGYAVACAVADALSP